jgi:hypothetical protein
VITNEVTFSHPTEGQRLERQWKEQIGRVSGRSEQVNHDG